MTDKKTRTQIPDGVTRVTCAVTGDVKRGAIDIEEIQKAVDAATDGPWEKKPGTSRVHGSYAAVMVGGNLLMGSLNHYDAHLIANAPTYIQQLIDRVQELEADLLTSATP